jgi:hypothetical protein
LKEHNYVAIQTLELVKTPEHARGAMYKTIGDNTVKPRNTRENLLMISPKLKQIAQFRQLQMQVWLLMELWWPRRIKSTFFVAKALRYNSQGKHIAEANNVALRARYVLQWLSSTGAVNPTEMKLSSVLTGAFKERA